MVSMEQIKKHVKAGNFGIKMFVFPGLYLSNGLRYACEENAEVWLSYFCNALSQVVAEDYGGFYEPGEVPVKGNEYYICESPFGRDIDTGIMVHRENGKIIMYFQFER